jgi:hypothetical protein
VEEAGWDGEGGVSWVLFWHWEEKVEKTHLHYPILGARKERWMVRRVALRWVSMGEMWGSQRQVCAVKGVQKSQVAQMWEMLETKM